MIAAELLLVLGVLVLIGYPLFVHRSEKSKVAVEGDEYHNLLYEKETAYIAIKDLDFDYKTGKLSENDYRELRRQYEEDAVAVLKRLENAEKPVKAQATAEPDDRFCPSCGVKCEPEDKFCSSCGTVLKK